MSFYVHYETNQAKKVTNILHLRTSNDANGLPRGLILCVGEFGHIVAIFDEGYNWGDLHTLSPDFAAESKTYCVSINVTVSEYTRWRSMQPGEVCRISKGPVLPSV